ncbi:hypothetical protein [Pedobacter kyungheensis]|nr:hypothetical protein [Pedobacter kyungheensis]
MMKIKNKIFIADNEVEASFRIENNMYVQYCGLANFVAETEMLYEVKYSFLKYVDLYRIQYDKKYALVLFWIRFPGGNCLSVN